MTPMPSRPGKWLTPEALANTLAVSGVGLIVAAAAMLHPAAGLAVAGLACVALAAGIVRELRRREAEPRE